jgi:uncharacterized membrane protein
MNKALDIGETLKLGWETFTKNAVPLIVGTLLMALVGGLSFGICLGPMLVGYNKMCLRAARGEQVAVGDVFQGFQQFLPAFVLMLVAGIAIMLGFLLLIIPGFIVAFLFFWAPWIMAENPELGAIDCLKASVELSRRDIGASAIFILVNVIVNAAGGVVPFGSLVTGPIAAAMAAHGVDRVRGTAPATPVPAY